MAIVTFLLPSFDGNYYCLTSALFMPIITATRLNCWFCYWTNLIWVDFIVGQIDFLMIYSIFFLVKKIKIAKKNICFAYRGRSYIARYKMSLSQTPSPSRLSCDKMVDPPPHYRAIYGQEGITFLMAGDKDKIYFLIH